MGRSEEAVLKRQIKDLKSTGRHYIARSALTFTLCSGVVFASSKILGFGYPYIVDRTKKYKLTTGEVNNFGDEKIIEKYLKQEAIKKYIDKDSKILVGSNYKYNGKYYRDVSVYKVDGGIDTNTILNNIDDYVDSNKKVDNYKEYNSDVAAKYLNKKEITIKYCDVNLKKYKIIRESKLRNTIVSGVYTLLFLISGGTFCYYINDALSDNKREIAKLKYKRKMCKK